MASHNLSWVPRAHVRFGDLNFIVTMEGELARAPAIIQPFHSADLDAITEALEEERLHAWGEATNSLTLTTGGSSASSASS